MIILVFSDTHRNKDCMLHAIAIEKPNYVIHLGDHIRDTEAIIKEYPMLPVLSIKGNCDFEPDGKEQAIAEYGGLRILAAHGHRYGVKSGLLRYLYAAKENRVDIALFGHTHQGYCEFDDNLWLMNPGACSGGRPTYGWIKIENKQAICQIKHLEDWR